MLDAPALTVAISPQPDVLHGLTKKRGFHGRGLLARFVYMLPASNVGFREHQTTPVPPEVSGAYGRNIRALLDMPASTSSSGRVWPYTLKLSNPAREAWKIRQAVVEEMMRPGGQLEHLRDWGGKLPGTIARLAGLLHCAEHVEGPPQQVFVSEATMDRAINLSGPLIRHAIDPFDCMGTDEAKMSLCNCSNPGRFRLSPVHLSVYHRTDAASIPLASSHC